MVGVENVVPSLPVPGPAWRQVAPEIVCADESEYLHVDESGWKWMKGRTGERKTNMHYERDGERKGEKEKEKMQWIGETDNSLIKWRRKEDGRDRGEERIENICEEYKEKENS